MKAGDKYISESESLEKPDLDRFKISNDAFAICMELERITESIEQLKRILR